MTVLDPAPKVTGIKVTPENPLVCQPVTLMAEGVTGKAPLSIQWTVNQITLGVSNPVTWNTAGLSAGPYPVTVKVSKAGYPDAMFPTTVTLAPLPGLPAQGTFAPTNEPFSAGSVQFRANVTGATEWKWDFGDGTGQDLDLRPGEGAEPADPQLHAAKAQRAVHGKLWVRNCVERSGAGEPGIQSAALPVTITNVDPLSITLFQAQGCGIFCDFTPGQTITFQAIVKGTPPSMSTTGTATARTSRPARRTITTHSYGVGLYTPMLRVRRGSEMSAPFRHPVSISVQNLTPPPPPPPPPASVSVGGPSTGQINQPYAFTAAGSNCTPGSTWNWNAGAGGTVSGNGASVTITWAASGLKTVQASSGNCGTGSRNINITDTGTGGLTAAFTSSPANPQINQVVSFTSTSTGNPTVFLWEFGDGTTAPTSTATHAYAAAGAYVVKLTIAKDCVSGNCSSQTSTMQTVVVSAGPQLTASFASPNCTIDLTGERCEAKVGQAVSLTSTGTGATSYSWSFSDGTPAGTGAQVSHTWTQPGNYLVQLTVGNGTATASTSRLFVVTGENVPQVNASFTTDATCNAGNSPCEATVGQAVSFTSTSTGATSYSWSFNDGTPAGTGAQVSHTWTQPGNYLVQLTASNGAASANASRQLVVKPAPVVQRKSVVLPWIAQTRGALMQSSDLYVHNPGKTAMDVTSSSASVAFPSRVRRGCHARSSPARRSTWAT